MTNCIYCNADVGHHKGDHIIPAALGGFRGAKLFTSICEPCNNELSALDQTLLNFTGVRLYRDIALGGTKRRGKDFSSWPKKNSGDAQAPVAEVIYEGDPHPTEVEKPGGTTSVENLRFEKAGSDTVTIKLFPKINSESFKKKVEERIGRNIDWSDYTISGDIFPKNHENYNQIFKDAFGFNIGQLQESPLQSGDILHQFTFEEKSGRSLRAIAKIALHYYLTYSNRHNGFEDIFNHIKEYIKDNSVNYYVQDFSSPLVKCDGLSNWKHEINSFDIRHLTNNRIVCVVGLFWANHSSKTLAYPVEIANYETGIRMPNNEPNINTISSHQYIYYEIPKQLRTTKGEIIELVASSKEMKNIILRYIR